MGYLVKPGSSHYVYLYFLTQMRNRGWSIKAKEAGALLSRLIIEIVDLRTPWPPMGGEGEDLKPRARLEELSVYPVEKVKPTAKGETRTYKYWYAS